MCVRRLAPLLWAVAQQHSALRAAEASCGGGGMSPQQNMPCPLPRWAPTYNITLSTFVMPGRSQGLISDGPHWENIRRMGLIDVDWSNGENVWMATSPMSDEEMLVQQAERIRAANKGLMPGQKVFVYRDPVIAYPWFSSVRKIMDDPSYDPWFLRFRNGSDGRGPLAHDNDGTYNYSVCDRSFTPPKCSELFHYQGSSAHGAPVPAAAAGGPICTHIDPRDPVPGGPRGNRSAGRCDCGRVPCGFYLFDHRSSAVVNGQSLRQWLVHNLTVSPTGILHPDINGLYIDDGIRASHTRGSAPFGDMNANVVENMGLSGADIQALSNAWAANVHAIEKATVAAGGFLVQMFTDGNRVASKRNCDKFFETACKKGSMQHDGPLLWSVPCGACLNASGVASPGSAPDLLEHLAGFLLVRGKYAYFAPADDGWAGSSYPYPPRSVYNGLFDRDYGTPKGLCARSAPGVWTREWTKATVSINCGQWLANITMKTAEE